MITYENIYTRCPVCNKQLHSSGTSSSFFFLFFINPYPLTSIQSHPTHLFEEQRVARRIT